MKSRRQLLTGSWGPVAAGGIIGILAPVLVYLGNPGNMGICVACFERDIAGALGLHRAATVQYLRPEIIGILLGAFVTGLVFREFKPKAGSAPLARFFLGIFAMIGALTFLGCPWRAYLRLAGGDGNAIFGILGLIIGIAIGVAFLKRGYSLGRARPVSAILGYVMPACMVVLLILLLVAPQFGRTSDGSVTGPIFFSETGPGSQHAFWAVALAVGLIVGFLAQRSRFCTVGAVRDLILMKQPRLFTGIISLIGFAFITNLILGQFHAGFAGQPVAHTNQLWNTLGMVLAGLAFTLAGGCPGRQLVLTGEGNTDSGVFVIGMVVGGGIAHTFSTAASTAGPGPYTSLAVLVGLAFCLILGLTMKELRV